MAVALRLPVSAASVTPDCCAVRCVYHPGRIGFILAMLNELAQSGFEPTESLISTLVTPESPYERRPDSFGPSEPTGAQIVADIHRAIRAGRRSPTAIAAYLCPLALLDPPL